MSTVPEVVLCALLEGVDRVYLTGLADPTDDVAAIVTSLRMLGFDVHHAGEVPDGTLAEVLDADVSALVAADAVVTLAGWELSPASVQAVAVADALGKRVLPLAVALTRQFVAVSSPSLDEDVPASF